MALRVREAMATLANGEPTLYLKLNDDRMLLNGVMIPLGSRAAQGLHSELDCLGLSWLEIDVSASGEELHQLAGNLRTTGQRILSTHSLQVVDLGELPACCRVGYREFGRRVASTSASAGTGTSAAGSIEQWIETACVPLETSGLDAQTRAACRGFVKESMRRVVERVEHSVPFGPTSSSIPASG